MSNQSPAAVAFRALVMLAALVLLPLAALLGTSLPGPVWDFLERKWRPAAEASATDAAAAPAFNPVYSTTPGGGTGASPPWQTGAAPAGNVSVSTAGPPSWGSEPVPANPLAPAVGDSTLLASYEAAAAAGTVPSWGSSSVPSSYPPAASVPPVGVPAGSNWSSNEAISPAALPVSPTAAAAPVADSFAAIERRLRELGATYLLLETWGNQGEFYRFYCRMSVAGGNDFTRHFEATDSDALVAMGRVLSEVEAWRVHP